MKKIFSALIISAMALSAMPLMSAPVMSNCNTSAVAETDNISSLATFLGADNAYFSFTNYTKKYLDTDMVVTDCEDQSYGISMLQILSHNGVFSVSDIQSGAESLSDVQFDSELESLIESYQLTRFNVPQLKMKRAFVKNDTETLVKSATDSMVTQKYFHISLSISESFPDGTSYSKASHDVAGIGITDGSWTFNGITYDKCVLTVDSNTESFDENYCIYVNTSDNTFCIPAYSDAEITAIIADDDILNYQGKLGEQTQPPVDVGNTVSPENTAKVEIFAQTNKQIGERYDNDSGEYIPVYKQTVEDYEVTAGDYTYKSFYLPQNPVLNVPVTESYSLNFKNSESNKCYLAFSVESKDGYSSVISETKAESAEISAHKVGLRTSDIEDYVTAELIPAEPLYKSSFNDFKARVFKSSNFTMTDREDGVLLHSDSPYTANMTFSVRNSNDVVESKFEFRLEPDTKNLLVRYDEEKQRIRAFIDRDGDNVYETEIQDGDINCNGMFDATDASGILGIYSALSTSKNYPEKYINAFADCNGDGVINATDAADVLSKYAASSTS